MAGRGCRTRHPAEMEPRVGSAAPDRLAPAQCAAEQAARQRRRPDAENFGGEGSFLTSILHHSITSSPAPIVPAQAKALLSGSRNATHERLGEATIHNDILPGDIAGSEAC